MINMDANSWLGRDYNSKDPHSRNNNGKLFHEFLERNQHLSVVNTTDKCKGSITRSRIVQGKVEESIIDFIIVCDRLLPHVKEMVIDEEKAEALTNFNSKTSGRVAKTSDHNSMFVEMLL